MEKAQVRPLAVLVAVAALIAAVLAGIDQKPADADVTAVSGSAYGYYANVSLFGGAYNPRGPAPSVTLPPGGGNETDTDPDGASVVYGPAAVFSNTGPLTVSTSGSTGPTGSSTSSATVEDIEQNDPFSAVDGSVSSTCIADETGLSGSAEIAGARLVLQNPDSETEGEPGEVVVIPPVNPAPNTEYSGTIAPPVNDNFRIVFNEQIFGPDDITVNAVHLYFTGPTGVGELILAQSHCDVSATTANAAPTAGDDTYATPTDTALVVGAPGVLSNDSDPESGALQAAKLAGTLDPIPPGPNVNFASDPSNGTLDLNADGSFTYTPETGFSGVDTFLYSVSDPRGGTDTATATITVGDGMPPTSTTSTSTTSTSTTSTSTTSTSTTSTSTTLPPTTTTSTTVPEGDFCGQGNDVLLATIVGTDGPDVITGTPGDDVIVGLGGDDQIAGLGGNDTICGGDGNDGISGDAGDDDIYGDAGNDDIRGKAGNDEIFTGTGNDSVDAGDGDDEVTSEGGNNSLRGGNGNDIFRLAENSTGIDRIRGEAGDDRANASLQVGQLGLQAGDYFDGGEGNDLVNALEGGIFFGGPGDDYAGALSRASSGLFYGGEGEDGVAFGTGSTATFYGGDGIDRGTASGGTIYGEAGDDNVASVGGTGVYFGGVGNDFVGGINVGGLFCGGPGDDGNGIMFGGTYYGEEGNDSAGIIFPGATFVQDGECPVQGTPGRFSNPDEI